MIRGIAVSRSAMAWEQTRSDTIANNVANLNTPEFKRTVAVGSPFADLMLYRMGDRANGADSPVPSSVGALGTGVRLVENAVVDEFGPLEYTHGALDVALSGPGAFVFAGPNGLGFTRRGDFQRNPDGVLVTRDGYPVLVGGQQVGAGVVNLRIEAGGRVIGDGAELGILDVAAAAPDTRVAAGALERSNVDLAQELTDLITALRSYQVNQRALAMQEETLAKAANELGKI